jgi:hypothetical protein
MDGDTLPTRTLRAEDLARLRRAHLEAEAAGLRARLAGVQLGLVTLDTETRYGLLGQEATVDIRTGAVQFAPEAGAAAQQPEEA